VEDTHQVALVVDALNGCCSFALVKIAHEVDVVVIALQLLDELDNIGDKVSSWIRVWLVVPGEMTPLLLRGRKSAHCEGVTLTDSVRGDDSEGDAIGAHQGVRYPASHAGGVRSALRKRMLDPPTTIWATPPGFHELVKVSLLSASRVLLCCHSDLTWRRNGRVVVSYFVVSSWVSVIEIMDGS
jgi:hypothetical protein